jgi:hypothetical protein
MFKRFCSLNLWTRVTIALGAVALVLALFIMACGLVNRIQLRESYRKIASAYPQFVVQRIRFSKYLVQGTLPDNDPHFAKLDIWLVRGSADVQFDLSDFSVDKRRTDYLNRVLFLSYGKNDAFRENIAISINPADIRQVESIKPQEYTEKELKKFASNAALVTGAAGAIAGGLAASKTGATEPRTGLGSIAQSALAKIVPVTKYAGGIKTLLGAAAGGALAAGTAYCFTDNFVSALQSTARERVSAMDMIAAAKPLVTAELANTGETEAAYRAAFEARLGAIAKRAGWNGVVIDYGAKR